VKITNYILSFREIPYPLIRSWVIGFVACLSFVLPSTLTVPTDYPNIQAGIDASVEGDTVLVLDGEFTGEGNYDIRITSKGIVLISESGPDNCTINAQGLDRCIVLASYIGEEINGFTITNGFADFSAGVSILGEPFLIQNCIFLNNIATVEGGAVGTIMGHETVFNNCIFIGNQAPLGPGIAVGNWSDVYVYNSIIYDQISPGVEGGYYTYYCLWSAELPFIQGSNNIIGDALFVDSDNGNFQLQLASPCINAGSPDYPTDPDGTLKDIGPYYYHLELQGDTNFDSSINVIDILITVSIILQETESYNAQLWSADFNNDNVINVVDVLLIIDLILN